MLLNIDDYVSKNLMGAALGSVVYNVPVNDSNHINYMKDIFLRKALDIRTKDLIYEY